MRRGREYAVERQRYIDVVRSVGGTEAHVIGPQMTIGDQSAACSLLHATTYGDSCSDND